MSVPRTAGAAGTVTRRREAAADDDERPGADLVRSADSTHIYLTQISRVPLLDAAQEVELAKRIEVGLYAAEKLRTLDEAAAPSTGQLRRDLEGVVRDGERAQHHLVAANVRLVVSLTRHYTGRGLALPDLIQEGNLGLIRAMQKFDYTQGYKFSTYATWWIRQSISRALADQARTIRLPVHLVEEIATLGRIRRELGRDLGREPTPEELAALSRRTPKKVREMAACARTPISLDVLMTAPDAEASIAALVVEEDDEREVRALAESARAVLEALDPRWARVLRLRFGFDGGEPMTLHQIGGVLGVTRERIRQIESAALSWLAARVDRELAWRGTYRPPKKTTATTLPSTAAPGRRRDGAPPSPAPPPGLATVQPWGPRPTRRPQFAVPKRKP